MKNLILNMPNNDYLIEACEAFQRFINEIKFSRTGNRRYYTDFELANYLVRETKANFIVEVRLIGN